MTTRRPPTFALAALCAVTALSGLTLAFGLDAHAPGRRAQGSKPASEFEATVKPFLAAHCLTCHSAAFASAGLNLEAFQTYDSMSRDSETWTRIVRKISTGQMPPPGSPRPDAAKATAVTAWITAELDRLERAVKPEPGRVTARRLNRAEYNNTVRDLLGVETRPADDFPQDDSGYGFDNIGDVLSLSPPLMEKYLAAAERVARTALFGPEKLKPRLVELRSPRRGDPPPPVVIPTEYDRTGLSQPNAIHLTYRFPVDGKYTIRAVLTGYRADSADPMRFALWIDGAKVQEIEVKPYSAGFPGEPLELAGQTAVFDPTPVEAGDHWLAVSMVRMYEGLPASLGGPNPSQLPERKSQFRLPEPDKNATPAERAAFAKRRAMFDEFVRNMRQGLASATKLSAIQVGGPYQQQLGPSLQSRRLIYTCGHLNGQHLPGCARKILGDLARRAFRRPVSPKELAPYLRLVDQVRTQGDSFEEGLCTALQALLVSPHFLFRVEHDLPVRDPSGARRINDYELASRLSYFLWSSMPDAELMRCADSGRLHRPDVLQTQVQRMLKDPKAETLAENFAGQWLELRKLEALKPDTQRFPNYDEYLRLSMRRETETFFKNLVREDRSILDFIDADYTFLNERLAKFYGIPGVVGPEFRRVDLAGTHRSGVLTQAAVLTVTSYATRTSPVLRGKWILENFLNTPPPPPPPGVPALEETKIEPGASLRQQMEEHRKKPLCASCHARMDPLGFGLENFNAIGSWRTLDGKTPVEASGTLPTGKSFSGPQQLEAILKQDAPAFAACLTTKLLTYALGRGLERYDLPTVRQIADRAARDDYRFSSLVLGIVTSLPFQERKGTPPHESRDPKVALAPNLPEGGGRDPQSAASGRDGAGIRGGRALR